MGGQQIVRDASLEVGEGEAVLLVGPSGSGKSTLLKALSGVIPSVVSGVVKGYCSPSLGVLRGRAMYVHQEPWFFISTPYVWSEVLGYAESRLSDGMSNVDNVLGEFGLGGYAARTTYTMSSGEIQRLAFLIAAGSSKDVLLLDEPSSYLDRRNSETLVRYAEKILKEYGKTLVIVDHDMSLWSDVVSRTFYMHEGLLTDSPANPFGEVLEHMMRSLRPPDVNSGDCMRIIVDSFKFPDSGEPLLKDVDFDVCRGEVVVVKGVSGSGKTTLLKLVAGEYVRGGRVVRFNGVRRKLVLVPDNPLLFLSSPTPAEEVGREGLKFLEFFGLSSKIGTPIMRLSSGERRRLAIASALARGYEFILMDEPTAGLDPINKHYVLETIVRASTMGTGFVIASHDPFVEMIANKVVSIERR
ncbi:MAG: ATP-binding cassette domain-containing protein [Zestosphaera sp.]